MKKILTEPLLHFAVLGALLFIANGALSNSGSGDRGEIVITQGQIEHLAAGFTRAWQRSPAPEELMGLIRDRVREEVLYREAIAIGLDQDDAIIRRRLRQKMEFISDDLAAQAEPTDAELNAYLQAHPDAFRIEPRYTFRQVYLNPQQRGNHLQRDAAQLLAQLNKQDAKTDSAQLGDALMLEPAYVANSLSDITKQFGARFAARLSELTLKQWQGPVESGYGVHLVFVSERTAGRLPELAEVRGAVRREWVNARRLETNEKLYQELLTRYTVTVEELTPTAANEPAQAK